MACTATATPKVAEEIVARLGLREPERVRSGLRPAEPVLRRAAVRRRGLASRASARRSSPASSMAENRPAVVYCGTRKCTEEIARAARRGGPARRRLPRRACPPRPAPRAQDAFMRGEADVVVATNAFGMGVDKADVRSVWHWALPVEPGGLLPGGRPRRPRRRARPAPCCWRRARTSAGSCASSARPRSPSTRSARSSTACARRPGRPRARRRRRPRPHPARRRRARRRAAARPGAGGRDPRRGSPRRDSTAPGSPSCAAPRPTAAGSPTARSSATRPRGDRCRRRQLLDHFGDPHARRAARPLLRRARPARLAAADHRGRQARPSAAPADDGPPVSDDELAPLKAWRRERADGKPAYTVATDATLREIVRRRPRHRAGAARDQGHRRRRSSSKHAESLLELLHG